MHFLFFVAAAQLTGLFLNSEAFIPRSLQGKRSLAIKIGSWDNDDFLASLSGNNPNAGTGKEEDELPPDDMPGAELSEEAKQRIKEQNEKEEFSGGSRFKQLLEAAKQAEGTGVTPMENPYARNPFAGIEGLDPQATPQPSPNVNLDEMSVEQQAEMFRAMMKGQQPAPAQVPSNLAIPPLPKPPAPDRKVGRNRDADTIQNTADVYFAQLKRDSTVRGIARIQGDWKKSNEVFTDEKIEELGNAIKKNPHLDGNREKERQLIESATEEMLAFQKALEGNRGDPTYSGISYKQKLAQRRENKGGGSGATQLPTTDPASLSDVSKQAEPNAESSKAPSDAESGSKTEATHQAATNTQAALSSKQGVSFAPRSYAPPTTGAASPSPASASAASSPSNTDEIRRNIRTLMGLILKHRGGPGFGAGGLKGQDIAEYEKFTNEITALLRKESSLQLHSEKSTDEATPSITLAASAASDSVRSGLTSQMSGQYGDLATVPNSPSGRAQVDSMLACIEGAILMYRNSPPELKDGVLLQIRSALLSAVNTCNKVMGHHEGVPSSTQGAGTQVESMLACVEGAILMYRNSPEELKGGVLMTLRAALLSALSTCNRLVAEKELENYNHYQQATAGMQRPTGSRPTQFYDMVQVHPEGGNKPNSPSGNDENSKILDAIYSKVKSAAGNGKMGLREDLSPQEASDLANSLVEMRSIMMEELDTGIPEAIYSTSHVSQNTEKSSGSTSSTYQQMLAKAREGKASNN